MPSSTRRSRRPPSRRVRLLFPNWRSRSRASGGAAAARSRTPAAASRPRPGSPSTTAGRASRTCRLSRPRSRVDTSRKVIARNDSPDIGFDRSINPYRGCEHGCVYCFARPTHAFLGLSPGLDFEIQAAGQAGRAGAAREGTGGARLRAADDRDRHQYRSLPADRARTQNHARHSGSAGARRPSGRHRDQIGAGDARHRHPRADGEAQSGQGGAVGDHARSETGAHHGAARLDAAEAAGGAAAVVGGRHSRRR